MSCSQHVSTWTVPNVCFMFSSCAYVCWHGGKTLKELCPLLKQLDKTMIQTTDTCRHYSKFRGVAFPYICVSAIPGSIRTIKVHPCDLSGETPAYTAQLRQQTDNWQYEIIPFTINHFHTFPPHMIALAEDAPIIDIGATLLRYAPLSMFVNAAKLGLSTPLCLFPPASKKKYANAAGMH